MNQQCRHASELKAVSLSKSFGHFQALKEMDLTIRAGEFLTLLGPSGSGKTTFLMTLAGFLAPTHGRLEEDGVDITNRPPDRRNFGMVFQGYALFPHFSVRDNVAFPLRVRNWPREKIARRVHELLERVGLEGHADKKPLQLSGGQQQRVALARALAFEPGVLLLDEPFSALDKNLREGLQAEMRRIHLDTGTTFVLVTHDQTEALTLSDRVAIFDHGRLMQVSEPKVVYTQPANRFVAEFLGRINLLPLTECRVMGDRITGRLGNGTLGAPLSPDASVGESALLAVRPEYLRLGPPAEDENCVTGVIVDRSYNGPQVALHVALPTGQRIQLSMDPETAGSEPGTEIAVSWPVARGFVLANEGQTT